MHGKSSELAMDPLEVTESSQSDITPSESDHTAGTSEEPPQKRIKTLEEKTMGADYRGRMSNLKTQHFMELLCAIRDTQFNQHEQPRNDQTKCFGLYIVMHRVYLTCLNVESTKPLTDIVKSSFIRNDDFHGHNQKGWKLRLVCSKYLNIFKPAHFRALVAYLHFLVLHEYKHITYNKI